MMPRYQRERAGVARLRVGPSEAMGAAARRLHEEHGDVDRTLQSIAALAVATVPGAERCGVSRVVDRRAVEPRAATDEVAARLGALQSELGQGPGLDAVWLADVVRVDETVADRRWPRFAPRAADLGACSMLCLQLFVAGGPLGAVSLYASVPHAFSGVAVARGRILAAHAAVALAAAELEAHLRRGIDSRDLIGQAKGILMERYRMTAEQAFDVLVQVSQERNRKLADVARELADTGSLPGGGTAGPRRPG